ncbi:MAG: EFR1 family ferrodoxin [Oscillospiraceae bacterium]|nr:EFR1 family ferrodoxin [Oscillospiraceae bacterium]
MVFYYTGTGNSKYAAEKLLAVSGGELISITDCVKSGTYEFTPAVGEIVGFVFPVYCYTVPMTVQNFARKLKINTDREVYSFAVATCGATTGMTLKTFNKLFPVSAMFGLPMVDNYLPFLSAAPTNSEVEEILANSDGIMDGIISSIAHRETGNLNKYEGKGSKLISVFAGKGYAKHRPTADFNVNDSCVGCGLCESICPTSSVKVVDGFAMWTEENCDLCFACLHRCPNEAINYRNKTQGKGRYINPKIEL